MVNKVPSDSRRVSTTLQGRISQETMKDLRCIPIVIALGHETFQRTESAIHDELEITQLTLKVVIRTRICCKIKQTHLGENDILKSGSLCFELLR